MTIPEVRANIGNLVFLNGNGGISAQLKEIVPKRVKFVIVKQAHNGDAVLEIPNSKRGNGFIIVNPVGIDIAPKYNLQRS